MIVIAAMLLSGCATPVAETIPSTIAHLQTEVKDLRINDGIDAREAEIISKSYFWRFVRTSCGAVGPPKDINDIWDVQIYVGYAAIPAGNIVIDKKSGKVSWENGPSVEDPRKIWEYPVSRTKRYQMIHQTSNHTDLL